MQCLVPCVLTKTCLSLRPVLLFGYQRGWGWIYLAQCLVSFALCTHLSLFETSPSLRTTMTMRMIDWSWHLNSPCAMSCILCLVYVLTKTCLSQLLPLLSSFLSLQPHSLKLNLSLKKDNCDDYTYMSWSYFIFVIFSQQIKFEAQLFWYVQFLCSTWNSSTSLKISLRTTFLPSLTNMRYGHDYTNRDD